MKTNSVILFSMAVMASVAFIPVALVPAQAAPVNPEVPNACTLLSRLEVGEAAGTTVGEGELRLRTATTTRCMFARSDGGNAALLVRRIPSEDRESEQREHFQRGVQFGAYREMAGIGDRAFSRQIGQGSVLCVFVGEYYLQVSLFRMGEGPWASANLKKLARRAIARLRTDNHVGTFATRTSPASPVAAQR
jgi:hypothetical protein